MKNTKRILSMLLAILMVLGACPLAVLANDEAPENKIATETGAAEPKPYYTYYVQDGLTFLWSGEDYKIGDKQETVKALVNILNPDEKLDKMMYGRQFSNLAKNDGNGNATFNPMAYYKTNGGVVMVSDKNLIYTDIVPMTVIDGVEVLTDMTFEVSQSYFDKIATSTATTYSSTRGHDGGMAWYGPLGSISNNKMPYKSVVVGTTLYFYGEYADESGKATPFYFTATPKTASNAKYTYENGVMTKITDQAVLDLIDTQANAKTLTVDGIAKDLTAAGNNYSSFLAINAHGTAGVYQHGTAPLSSAGYDRAGQNQFLNNTINEAFTSTIIFDYASLEASTKFNFTVGRDGVKYAAALTGKAYDATIDTSVGTYFTGTTGTYNGVTLTKNETFLGFIGDRDSNHTSGTALTNMLNYSIADEGRNFAFTFGTNIATVLHSIRMYDRVLTDAELAQNHFVDVAMKLGADLAAYDAVLASENADEILPLVHAIAAGKDEGDFTKEEFEVAIKKASVPYYKLYVQDGLVFLWTGEGNELTSTEQKVTAFKNLVGEQDINKISYGRHYSHYYQGKSFTFYKTDKGVHNNGGDNFGLILTDLVPTREVGGEKILSDMTLEVSQAYPSTYQTKLGGTANIATRNYDPGYVLLGALGAQSYTRVAYKQEYAKNASGALHNFVPYYYVPNAYADDLTYDAEILYVDVSSSAATNKEFPIYRKNENGVMIATTTDKHGNPIDDVYLNPKGNAAGTGAATGVYMDTATGKLYYTYDPYYATRDSKVALNSNGHIQGAYKLPGIDALGTTLISNWSGNLTAYDYPLNGRPNFMNAYQDQAFTTTLIFNYDESATSTSIPFTFTAGRDGAFLNTTNHTYDTTKDYTPAEKKWDTNSKSDDNTTYNADNTVASTTTVQKYGFSYGIGTAMTYYAIRLYDRALTTEEIAQNHFVDIAMKLDADLSYYKLILEHEKADKLKSILYAVTESKTENDFTKESFEKEIYEVYKYTIDPSYHKLYVQDGLVFLWTGEDYELTNTAQAVTAFENLVGEQDITEISYGRHYMHYYQGKSFTFYKTDKGVHNNGGNNFGLVLTDLVPTREVGGEQILSDMTLEVSQMYPSTYQTKLGGKVNLSTRNYDPGYMVFGALGNLSYTRVAYNTEYAKNESGNTRAFVPFYYIPNAYANDTSYKAEILYADTANTSTTKSSITLYRKDNDGVMVTATADKHGNAIANVYCTKTAVYAEGATGKLYYTYDPYFATRSSTVELNQNGITQGALSLPAIDANGIGPIANWNSAPLTSYDKPISNTPNFMNAKQDQAFTTTMIFNYDESATSTSIPFTFTAGRDGVLLGTTNHTYDTATDYTPPQKMWDVNAQFDDDVTYDVGADGKYNTADDTFTVNEILQKYAFSYGVGTAMTYYSIRLYDRALTEEEQAQNNFIDIAYQFGLNLSDYALADEEVKASIHALTKGKSAADFDAEELKKQIDLRIEGDQEFLQLLGANALSFEGYSVRMYDYAGLRAVFKIDTDFVDNAKTNKDVKISEIGALVAIKGDRTVEDLTVDTDTGMVKRVVYANGEWVKNASGREQIFTLPNSMGELETYFALTTTFKNQSEQTKEKYRTELLYRGYMTVTIGEQNFTLYTDMTAPSFAKISMSDVSKVFVLKSLDYKEIATIQSVFKTCGIKDIHSLSMYEIDTQDTFPQISVSEHSAIGVMEAFRQRLDEMPEHVRVIEKLQAEDFMEYDSLTIYVATDGSDTQNDGSIEKPFATLARALGKATDCGGATIYVRGGTYYLDTSLKLREQHSGTNLTPLFITNYEDEEVIFTTSLTFSGSQLVRADEADFLPANAISRLNTFNADNAKNVYAIDLTTLGLTEKDLASYAKGETSPGLYVGDEKYRVVRWPNYGATDSSMLIKDGFIQTTNSQSDIKEVGKVTGGISSLYEANKDNPNNFFEIYFDATTYADHLLSYDQTEVMDNDRLWMHGSVYEEWDNRTVNLKLYKDESGKNYMHSDRAVGYGIRHSSGNHVYFFNMLEDLDTAFEYQVDVQNMVLYVYSDESLANKELSLCYKTHTAFELIGAQNVVIDGLNFERICGLAVNAKNSDHVYVQDCVFRNLSDYAVQLAGTKMSGVTYSEFYACNGIYMDAGGDMTVLEADRNFVQNNRFTNAGDNHAKTMGVRFSGVASVISHNYFLETRLYVNKTFESVIEYNEFERGSQYTKDNGPIYGGDASRALHVRYNFLHDLNVSCYGIYLDDMAAGDYVYGNIVHYADGVTSSNRCINLHNGSMHVIVNNICLNANGPGIQNNINYYAQTIDGVKTGGGGLGYRWRDIITNRLSKNGNYLREDVRYSRFPMYAAYTEVVDRAIEQMNANPDWHHSNKLSTEVDELYVRTPLYNVYLNNVSYSCKDGTLKIPTIGRDTARIENNVNYATGTTGIFTDYANGDYSIPADSIIYDSIPGFVATDMTKIGVLAD